MTAELRAQIEEPLPERLPVGRGAEHPLSGWLAPEQAREVAELRLLLDGEPHPAWLDPRPHPWDRAGRHELWAWAPLAPVRRPQPIELELEATMRDGSRASAVLGGTLLVPCLREPLAIAPPPGPADEPPIVVCMATCDPDPALFERQLASLRAQTHARWVCIVCDDRSSAAGLATVRAGCASDPRFVLVESREPRRGPYRNFQQALRHVPQWAAAVAFSDQDDAWYPHKLATLLRRLEETGALLAYSDVRIVREDGERIADTYWTTRRNNYDDLASLLVANTITGAASLFRASLLDDLLPFPWPIPGVMHDWWVGTAALALGEVAYVEEPLHDYVQHGANVLGHQAGAIERLSLAALREHLRAWVPGRPGFQLAVMDARIAYFMHVRRLMLSARVLERRAGDRLTADKRAVLRRIGQLDAAHRNIAWMMGRGALRAGRVSETVGKDLMLGRGLLWRRWAAASGLTAPMPR